MSCKVNFHVVHDQLFSFQCTTLYPFIYHFYTEKVPLSYIFYLSNRKRFSCLHSPSKHERVLGEFGITIENSPTLACFYQAMYTQLKSFNCFYTITFQEKKSKNLCLWHWLKEKFLPVAKCCLRRFVCVISSCFAKKDAFHNTDFSRLKCHLKRKKLTLCVCKDCPSFSRRGSG